MAKTIEDIKYFIFIIYIFCFSACCENMTTKRKIIGKDISSDRWGNIDHFIYFEDGQKYVSGSDYYKLKVGDTVEISSCEL